MRPLRDEEHRLIAALFDMVEPVERPSAEEELFAIDLDDGGMGSIRLTDKSDHPRKMSRQLVSAYYTDADGTLVSISINLDEGGRLSEVDFWKVDFSPLNRFPTPELLRKDEDSVVRP